MQWCHKQVSGNTRYTSTSHYLLIKYHSLVLCFTEMMKLFAKHENSTCAWTQLFTWAGQNINYSRELTKNLHSHNMPTTQQGVTPLENLVDQKRDSLNEFSPSKKVLVERHTFNPLSAEHFRANWLYCQYWRLAYSWEQALYIGIGHDVPGYVNRALKGLIMDFFLVWLLDYIKACGKGTFCSFLMAS